MKSRNSKGCPSSGSCNFLTGARLSNEAKGNFRMKSILKHGGDSLTRQCCRASVGAGGSGQPDCANLDISCPSSYINKSYESSKVVLAKSIDKSGLGSDWNIMSDSKSSTSDETEESSTSCESSTTTSDSEPPPRKPQKNNTVGVEENRLIMKYSPFVLLGNWAEELFLNEESMKTFLLRRNRKELTIQNSRAMFTNLLKDAVVTAPGVSVKYGDTVQISTPDVYSYDKSSKGLCLSGVISISEIDRTTTLIEGCQITASAFRGACARNVFKLVSLTPNKKDGDPVGFGETVAFKVNDTSSDLELFIECEFPNVNLIGDAPYGALKLSSVITRYCRFKPQELDANKRDLVLGEPIPPNTKLLITSASTHRNLCADTNYWMNTYFGPECRAICLTVLDINKRILPENHWMFEAKVEPHPSNIKKKEFELEKEETHIATAECKAGSALENTTSPPKPTEGSCSASPSCAPCTLSPKTEPTFDTYPSESEQKFPKKPGFPPQSHSHKDNIKFPLNSNGPQIRSGGSCKGNGLSQNFPGLTMGQVRKIANSADPAKK